jgi:hypothetical protein
MPATTANPNPQVTRNSEVMRSVNRRPVRASLPNARRTSRGAGNALGWKTPLRQTMVQITISAATTVSGRATDRMVPIFVIVIQGMRKTIDFRAPARERQ